MTTPSPSIRGVQILAPAHPAQERVLTPAALEFIVELQRRFNPRRVELLASRVERQKRLDAGEKPDFLPETKSIRESEWTAAPIPLDLQDRRVEITGEAARSRVYLMRSRSDAVLTGIGTVLADDPILTSRLPGIPSPVRVILDSTLRLPLASKLVATARQVPLWVITGQAADSARQQTLAVQGVDVLRATTTDGKLDLGNVLALLARRGITRLMVESGPILAAAFLHGDLIDEAALFRSRRVIGRDGIEALDGLPLSALTQSLRLKAVGSESIEADTLQKFERA